MKCKFSDMSKFPKKDPEFMLRKLTKQEASEDPIIRNLQALKSSKDIMGLLNSFDSNKPYKTCYNSNERYGPVEYNQKYGVVSKEAIMADREPTSCHCRLNKYERYECYTCHRQKKQL